MKGHQKAECRYACRTILSLWVCNTTLSTSLVLASAELTHWDCNFCQALKYACADSKAVACFLRLCGCCKQPNAGNMEVWAENANYSLQVAFLS